MVKKYEPTLIVVSTTTYCASAYSNTQAKKQYDEIDAIIEKDEKRRN